MKKRVVFLAALPLILCSCVNNYESASDTLTIEQTTEPTAEIHTKPELPFSETMEEMPQEHELSPADPLKSLDIQPSDYFKPGVWTSTYTDDTGNFYIFDDDGIHARLIPMADAEGVDFTYSIDGSKMTMYVGEELTPYNAELETTDEGHVIIHMTFLGTQDELVYMSGVSAEGFTFYPTRKLSAMAERYYEQQTGQKLAGIECKITEDDMVVLNLYIHDENGWRSDVESYTVSMFSAAGWSSISCEPVDLSAVDLIATGESEQTGTDDIPDIVAPDITEES